MSREPPRASRMNEYAPDQLDIITPRIRCKSINPDDSDAWFTEEVKRAKI